MTPHSDEYGVAKKGPDRSYELGPWRFGRYGWRQWEATLRGSGAHGRTPLTAMVRTWRWHREIRRNPGKYAR